jgi:hypothetical protein
VTDAFDRAVRRGDSRLFDDVTLRNQTAETDANGDPERDAHNNIVWAGATETATPGEIVYRGTPQFARRVDGIDADVDVVVWISNPDVTFTDGAGDETRRATRIRADGQTYRLMDTFDERNGRRRGHGELEE